MAKKLTNEEFQDRLKQLRILGVDIFTNDTYIGHTHSMDFYCSKNIIGQRRQVRYGIIKLDAHIVLEDIQ